MKTAPRTKKHTLGRLIEGMGDTIIFLIRIQGLLGSRRGRRRLFRLSRKKIHHRLRPTLQRVDPHWQKLRKHVFQPMEVRGRWLWLRIVNFHSRPLPRLRRIYLGGFAAFLLAAIFFLWLGSRFVPVQDPQSALPRLMEDTANLIGKKQLGMAEKNLAKLKTLAPNHPTVLTFSGAIKSLRKDYDGARADYTLALQAAPSSFTAAFNLAEVDFVTGNYAAAATQFRAILKTRPQDEILLFRLFLCEMQENNEDLANIYLDRLSPAGVTPAYYYANAMRQFRNKNTSEARKLLNTAKTLYPGKTEFFDSSVHLLGYK